MEITSIRLIKIEGLKRLKHNLPRAISLVFVMLFLIVFLHISRLLTDIFIHSFGVTHMLTDTLSLSMLIAIITTIILSLTLLMPLWLNIKKWFMNLSADGPPHTTTLSLLNSPRKYFKSVFYSAIKASVTAVLFLLLFVPAIIIFAFLRANWSFTSADSAMLIVVVMFILMIAFVILATVYIIYLSLGLFLSDYIYLSLVETNPIKAMLLSLKLSKNHRMKLITLYFSMLPYALSSLLVVPIVFTIPYMQCTLACFAKQQLGLYLYEKSQNGEQ